MRRLLQSQEKGSAVNIKHWLHGGAEGSQLLRDIQRPNLAIIPSKL